MGDVADPDAEPSQLVPEHAAEQQPIDQTQDDEELPIPPAPPTTPKLERLFTEEEMAALSILGKLDLAATKRKEEMKKKRVERARQRDAFLAAAVAADAKKRHE